jgi:hypothetical protein
LWFNQAVRLAFEKPTTSLRVEGPRLGALVECLRGGEFLYGFVKIGASRLCNKRSGVICGEFGLNAGIRCIAQICDAITACFQLTALSEEKSGCR